MKLLLLLLDITIPHPQPLIIPPPGFDESLIDLKPLAALMYRSHLTSIQDKYYQSKTASSAMQFDTMPSISEQNYYALIPFIIIHLLG
jgi:hypothetical protein